MIGRIKYAASSESLTAGTPAAPLLAFVREARRAQNPPDYMLLDALLAAAGA